MYPEPIGTALALVAGAVWVVFHIGDWKGTDAEDPVSAAQAAYVDGQIDEHQLERRLEVAVDERAQAMREELERINGVGPQTSRRLVREYRSWWALRNADREELLAIHDVGPSTADAVLAFVETDLSAAVERAGETTAQ